MYATDTFRLAIEAVNKNASGVYKDSKGNKVSAKELSNSLDRLYKWAHPQLSTEQLTKVVTCGKCVYYKRYRKKGVFKPQIIYACSRDMTKRNTDFYCKDGEERETED